MTDNLRSVIVFQLELDQLDKKLTDFFFCAPISLDAACPIESNFNLESDYADLSPMKPRKTRKQSKSADQVGRDLDIIAEIRGQRKPKELTIETFTPMETSYAQMVKGQSDGEQIADISTKDAVTYMSGNPAVQTVTGIIHLYRTDYGFDVSDIGPSRMLLMVHVPVDITSHELIFFIGNYESKLESMKIIRDHNKDQYMVLLKFFEQEICDKFYHSINGLQFNSLMEEKCQLAYVGKVEQLHPLEGAGRPLPKLTELPSCAVCLERMDESVRTVLTVLCNHSFHSSCLKKWEDLTCPVCRYTQVPSSEDEQTNRCTVCGSDQDLWICLICGNVGCGRYTSEHAQEHYLETQHNFAMALNDNRVWDYHGDYFVHRLIQNESSRKIIETKDNGEDPKEKAEIELNIQMECMALLTSQLEKQKQYWEAKLESAKQEMEEKNKKLTEQIETFQADFVTRNEFGKEKSNFERKIKSTIEKNIKVQKELDAEREMNKNLLKSKIEMASLIEKQQSEIEDLSSINRDLMIHLEAAQKINNQSDSELQNGSITVGKTKQNRKSKKRS